MSKNTFTLTMAIGFWEGELLVKALEAYSTRKNNEKISKKDLINLIKYQMDKAKEKENEK
jgi:hypothetical protein